jgi:hypothetical protein
MEIILPRRRNRRKNANLVVALVATAVGLWSNIMPCNSVLAFSIKPGSAIKSPYYYQLPHSDTHLRHRVFRFNGSANNDGGNNNHNNNIGSSIADRFLNPVIDDPVLPLTEAGLVQIVAPTLQLFWLVSLDSPYPSWAQPLVDTTFSARGAFLAPTLIHGAGLACCWLMGCLAAKAYEKPKFRVTQAGEYGPIITSTIQSGAFACGLLIFATQVDLVQEFHGYVQIGDSATTDIRIYRALVEVINDIFFQFIVLLPWRLFRSNFD